MIDIWLDINGQRLDLFFISFHFLSLSMIDITNRVTIFSLQGALCFNNDMDLNLVDFAFEI